jgi:threonine dehydrogenase-like Zn-dependent dehydrogenase
LVLAEELGAEVLSSKETFSHIFETSGVPAALLKAVDLSTSFTHFTLLGISDAALPLSLKTVVRRQLTILGSLIYDHPTDFLEPSPWWSKGVSARSVPLRQNTPSMTSPPRSRPLDKYRVKQ